MRCATGTVPGLNLFGSMPIYRTVMRSAGMPEFYRAETDGFAHGNEGDAS
ncbi:MAG: hypothetical protein WDO70_11005 [Alphaproteobacteria bacterium]